VLTRRQWGKSAINAFRVIRDDTEDLSSHSLSKGWAMRLYEASGHDLLIVPDGLGHRSAAVTQIHVPTARARVEPLILQTDIARAIAGDSNLRNDRAIPEDLSDRQRQHLAYSDSRRLGVILKGRLPRACQKS
jgi:hypothetical protein